MKTLLLILPLCLTANAFAAPSAEKKPARICFSEDEVALYEVQIVKGRPELRLVPAQGQKHAAQAANEPVNAKKNSD